MKTWTSETVESIVCLKVGSRSISKFKSAHPGTPWKFYTWIMIISDLLIILRVGRIISKYEQANGATTVNDWNWMTVSDNNSRWMQQFRGKSSGKWQ